MSRRELLGIGVGAAAGVVALPNALRALTRTRESLLPQPSHVDIAIQAARWIRRSRIETKAGVKWPAAPRKPESVGLDLYNGFPGVILFPLELFPAPGDRQWLDEARLGANELI